MIDFGQTRLDSITFNLTTGETGKVSSLFLVYKLIYVLRTGASDMLTIQISDSSRDFETVREIDESWINQQINRRRRDGATICVRISIKNETPDVNMALASAGCASSGAGGRPPNSYESRILDLWDEMGLHKPDFQGGNVIAFLKQLRKILG